MLRRTTFLSVVLQFLTTPLLICRISAAQQKPARPQQDQEIRLKAELVELRVVVTDKKGRLVEDLKQEDFEVLDNGQPQQISLFSVERVGRASSSKAKPDEGVRPSTAASSPPSRTIILFVDTLHLSTFSFQRVKRQLRQFIYRFAIYNAGKEPGATVKVELFQAETAVYQGDWQPLSSRTIRKDRKGLEAGGELKLGLDPGIYELRVTVREARGKKSEQRAAYLEVD